MKLRCRTSKDIVTDGVYELGSTAISQGNAKKTRIPALCQHASIVPQLIERLRQIAPPQGPSIVSLRPGVEVLPIDRERRRSLQLLQNPRRQPFSGGSSPAGLQLVLQIPQSLLQPHELDELRRLLSKGASQRLAVFHIVDSEIPGIPTT